MCTWLDVSSYLDKIMAPIVKTLLSYLKDSQHALEIFRDFNFLGQNKLVFTTTASNLNSTAVILTTASAPPPLPERSLLNL